jgi:GT2 family glycosyltransferase
VVVDNGSRDDSIILLRRTFPEVEVISLPNNTGFAAAVNTGIRATRGEYVALLNNDTEVAADWLAAAVAELDQRRDIAFAASKLLHFNDRGVIESVADGFSLYGTPFKIGEGERDTGRYSEPFEILSACAAASFYRRTLFDEIGLFDEDFFAYIEDIDLALRAQLAGYRGLSIPSARVYHMGTASSGGGPSEFTVRLSVRNLWWVMLKCFPVSILIMMIPLAAGAQLALLSHCLVTRRRPWLRRNLRSYFAGLGDAARGLAGVLSKRRRVIRRISTITLATQLCVAARQRRESQQRVRASG